LAVGLEAAFGNPIVWAVVPLVLYSTKLTAVEPEVVPVISSTTKFPSVNAPACRDVTVKEQSPANIAIPAKNRNGMMEDSKDEKI
jgi:hypothetical protein